MEEKAFERSGLDRYLNFVETGLTVSDPENLFMKCCSSAMCVNNITASGSKEADEMLHLYCHLSSKFCLSEKTCEVGLRVSV